MPGIVYVNNLNAPDWELLRHVPSLQFETGKKMPGNYWGRVSNGIFNRNQPCEDQRYAVFIDGEFYNRDEIWNGLNKSELKIPNTDHELIHALLCQNIEITDILRKSEGSFFMGINDKLLKKIIFGNDRFGLRPHYWLWRGNNFVLAPEVKYCVAQDFYSVEIQQLSVDEYFNYQCILADRTFFKDIYVFPSGSIGVYDYKDNFWNTRKYWSPEELYTQENAISFEDAVVDIEEKFLASVRKMFAGNYRFCIYLSSGLDSRQILAAYTKLQLSRKIDTFTYGLENCRDQIFAERMANIAGTNHHKIFFPGGKWLKEVAPLHTKLTECFHCLFHAHNFWKIDESSRLCDVNISGHFGDVIMGGSFQKWNNKSEASTYLFDLFRKSFGIGYTNLFEYYSNIKRKDSKASDLIESFKKAAKPFINMPEHLAIDWFSLEFRARKMIQYYFIHNRPFIEDRVPFLDLELMKSIYKLPKDYRKGRWLQIALIDRLNSKLSSVPWDKTNLPPTFCTIPYRRRQIELFMKNTFKLVFGKKSVEINKKYADYENWITLDMSHWIREVLFNKNSIVQNFFNRDFIEKIVNDHISGKHKNLRTTFKIGTMISFELMLQQMINEIDV